MSAKDEKITTVLSEYFSGNKRLKNGFINSEIQKIWKDKMPSSVNMYTKKMQFSYGKLYLYIESAALKHELFSSRDKIKHLLNTELEGNWVKEVLVN